MANIEVLIERIGDELEISVDSVTTNDQKLRRKEIPTGKAHGRNRQIKEQKRKRKHHGTGGDEHDLASGPHQTMILIDGRNDTVTFKSELSFVVDVAFDPAYFDPHEEEPLRSPFSGWNKPQSSKEEGAAPHPHVVKDAKFIDAKRDGINGTRPSDYHFYKLTVWCDGLTHDPDWFCDR
jgi:hypothetical protein